MREAFCQSTTYSYRSRKIKCITPRVGEKCNRCRERQLHCSNLVSSPHTQYHGPSQAPITSRPRHVHLQRFHDTGGHDIGTETPPEILREGELCVELLTLYFENYSDVHFMFDRDVFLREFPVDSYPKGIVYAMLALGIRYVVE